MSIFSINDLVQLYFLRHVSSNYFILRKTLQKALRYFIMHLYKQSSQTTTFTECTQLAAQLYPTTASNTSATHHMRKFAALYS
jgi:hypothetical protein